MSELLNLLCKNIPQEHVNNLFCIRVELEQKIRSVWQKSIDEQLSLDLQIYTVPVDEKFRVREFAEFSNESDFILIWSETMHNQGRERAVQLIFEQRTWTSPNVTVWFQNDDGDTTEGNDLPVSKKHISSDDFIQEIILWLEKMERKSY